MKQWIVAIERQELPIFRYTIHAINDVVSDEDSSTARLAQVILQDANLTARVLRIANSSSYNPTGSPINTISRAIVFIGFNMVRDLSLTLAVIEALLGRKGRGHVFRLMARAFHAAAQARACAEQRGDEAPEEVFIAALLYPIGELAFWCIADKEGDEILELMEQGMPPAAAQQQVLGFTFEQLTLALTQDWHLSDLLHSAINNPALNNPRVRDINDSQQLARATEQSWNSETARKSIERIAARLEMNHSEAGDWLRNNTREAVEMARLFGAGSITEYLPVPHSGETPQDDLEPEQYPQADPFLQLSILRDLTRMLEKQPNINLILETVLEGIYRGCGLDRTLFAVLSPDRKSLRAKHTLGDDTGELTKAFRFEHEQTPFFNWLYQHNDAVWIKNSAEEKSAYQLTSNLLSVINTAAFFAYPLSVNGKMIGILYADRAPSDRELNEDDFESFRHFCMQARMAIEYISAR